MVSGLVLLGHHLTEPNLSRSANGRHGGITRPIEIGCQCGKPIITFLRPMVFDRQILADDIAGIAQPQLDRGHKRCPEAGRTGAEVLREGFRLKGQLPLGSAPDVSNCFAAVRIDALYSAVSYLITKPASASSPFAARSARGRPEYRIGHRRPQSAHEESRVLVAARSPS